MENRYQSVNFYNSYFSKVEDIEIIVPFKESDNREEKHLITGEFKFKHTIHPLQIKVEIPKTFPHHKLTFWTKSLSGYPHLIYNPYKKASWFCLNTPFAETAEEQLDQEMARLKEWIAKQMNPALGPIIADKKVALALKKVHAYEWENPDEIKEFSQEAILTFIGDFGKYKKNFPERKGYLSCIKNASNKLYALEKERNGQARLPYVLVDELPNDWEDFLLMKEQFQWTDEDCHHLFPDLFPDEITVCQSTYSPKQFQLSPAEAKTAIHEAQKRLAQQAMPAKDKILIEKKCEQLLQELQEKGKLHTSISCSWIEPNPEDKEACAEYEQQLYDEYICTEVRPYELFYFALGIVIGDQIIWGLFYTNRSHLKYTARHYDLGIETLLVKELQSAPMWRENAQHMPEENFFGRGHLSPMLTDKKIAILGIGAIGSILAETLVRGGVKELTIWDSDLVEPGNICRSCYSLDDLGNSKTDALTERLMRISPFCTIRNKSNCWDLDTKLNQPTRLVGGDFYGNINYNSQEDVIGQLQDIDLVIDCTASNELLHFLSYALPPQKGMISLCITNHANELLCLTNRDGNLFEQRKLYLSKIEQDTKNFYVEGTGCYSSTFLAAHCDIAALVNLAVRDLSRHVTRSEWPHSVIWSYKERGVVADRLQTFALEGDESIRMTISTETLLDGEDLEEAADGAIGYLLGGYSKDGKHIFVSHFIPPVNAEEKLWAVFRQSAGIIDYIGDFTYSFENADEFQEKLINILAAKAANESINTNNPLLAVRHVERSISFYLYKNGSLKKFHPMP